MDDFNTVFRIGDKFYLHQLDGADIEYTIENISIDLLPGGQVEVVISDNRNGKTPYDMFIELYRMGEIYKIGQQQMAKQIRNMKQKLKESSKE